MESFFRSGNLTSVSLFSMVALLISSMVALIPLVAAGNALGLFRFGWQAVGDGFRRLPDRKRVWGTVYDSHSLRPLPFAVVRLLGADRRILEKRIADGQGRYGFLTTPGSLGDEHVRVSLEVEHEGYQFPSHRQEKTGRLIYEEPYHGESVMVHSDTLVNFDVPMDPAKKSGAPLVVRAPSVAAGVATAAMADVGFWIGIIAVPLAFALEPTTFSLGIVFIFAGVASLRLFGVVEHPYGTVSDASGRAVPFALVTLHDDAGKRVAFAVSDEKGRYVLTTQKGGYVLSVHTPANIAPPREIERSITARKGWVTQRVTL